MSKRIVSGIMLILLLVGMLTLAFNIQPVKAESETWTVDDDGPAAFSRIRDAITVADSAYASRASIKHWSTPTIKSFFENGLDTRLMDVFQLPFEAGGKWDFGNEVEWGDFAYVDADSVELVIGLSDMRPNSYSELANLIMGNGGELVNTVSMDGMIEAAVADIPHVAMSSFILEVEIAGLSRYIEPNVRVEVDFVPNDPDWPKQWGPQKIEANMAWDTTMGDPSVLVAVIDTGIDWDHPDLAANYVALGYDWVNNDPDPMDDHGHGTHCAGVIAAVLNNGIGIAGLAQVRIMAEKGLDSRGSGRSDELANAIVHAVDQEADILSVSWGSYAKSTVLHEAMKYAYDHGVLVIGAAGNDAISVKHYPAAYDEVVAVTATDESDNPAEFTNFGDWVEVAAPGVHIYSTVWDDSYAYMSGTSMSAPHVSGVAALIWSQFPSMTRDQVRAQLRYTSDDLGDPCFDVYYGYGRVNARKAVEQAPSDHDVLVLSLKIPSYVRLGYPAVINATILNMGTSDESDITVQLLVNGSVVDSKAVGLLVSGASTSVSYSWMPVIGGVYNITSYVVPVIGETIVNNNALFTQISVRIPQVIRVPDHYSTIQDAVSAAFEGDTIYVASGTYYENVRIDKEGLTLVGEDIGNTIIDGKGMYDVIFVSADNVQISRFTIRNSGKSPVFFPPLSGILLYSSKGHTINDTVILNNLMGIGIFYSSDITLRNNNMTRNTYNFGVDGDGLGDFVHDINASNTVDGKPLYYWVNEHDKQVPSDAGYVAVVNSTNIVVKDLNLRKNFEGVLFASTINSFIENVNASNNYIDINLVYSCSSTVVANTATNSQVGIQLQDSKGNNISRNTIAYDSKGLSLCYSPNNTISYNNVSNNVFGLFVERSDNNTINHNRVFNNTDGVYLRKSGYNALRDNNMTSNKYNFGVTGDHLSHFIQDVDTSNTVNGKPVYYWVNQEDKEIPADAGYVAVINSTSIAVRGLNLSNNVHGVLFAYTSKSLIENVNASNNTYGIYLYGSSNNTIVGNRVTSKSKRGIQLVSSNDNTISNNMITNNYIGIGLWLSAENNAISNNAISNGTVGGVGLYLDHSSSNTIGNNTVTNNDYGIELYRSGDNTLRNNNMTDNSYNFGVYGGSLSNFIQDIDASNMVDGKPIYYWVNQHDKSISGDAGYIGVINSTNIIVKELTLTKNGQGVLFAYTANSTIKNMSTTNNTYGVMLQNSDENSIIANNVRNNFDGIYLRSSDSNTIQSNTATNNFDGIYLRSSDSNTIQSNTATNNFDGIYLLGSRNNVVSNNTSLKNDFGISLQYGSDDNIIRGNKASGGAVGIYLTESRGNIISENTASDNIVFFGFGICLEWSSNNNTIIGNTITDNNYGIMLSYWAYFYGLPEQNNYSTICHNNFIENMKQALSLNSINTWDDGYPSGGNYWSDYMGVDLYYGPYQNLTGSDGIGDEPYVIDADNRDRYPLMGRWPPLMGDLNFDWKVDMMDIRIAAKAFASYPGHPRWSSIADVNKDNKVDMRDIRAISRNFGKIWP